MFQLGVRTGFSEGDHEANRVRKSAYDSEKLMQELIDAAADVYGRTHEIKAAQELDMSPIKVKKLLITGGVISYPETEQIQSLRQQGKMMEEIQGIMGLSCPAVNTYLTYEKVAYKAFER